MIRYKVKIQSKQGNVTEEFMNADNEEQLGMISKMQGFTLLEILETQDLNFESVANIKLDENLLDENGNLKPMTIEQQAMAELAAETNPEIAKQLPGNSQPMKLDSQGNIIAPPRQQAPPAAPKTKPIHFTDKATGIEFKVENGVVSKKDWVQCDSAGYKVIRRSSGRLIATDELLICKLDWVEIEEETEEDLDSIEERDE